MCGSKSCAWVKSAERGVYVKMRATWDWISPSGCESSWTSLLWSWEDSSNMTLKRQSCFRLSSSATWAEGLQAFKFPAKVSSRRSTAGAVRASNSSTTEAGAYSKKQKRPGSKWGLIMKLGPKSQQTTFTIPLFLPELEQCHPSYLDWLINSQGLSKSVPETEILGVLNSFILHTQLNRPYLFSNKNKMWRTSTRCNLKRYQPVMLHCSRQVERVKVLWIPSASVDVYLWLKGLLAAWEHQAEGQNSLVTFRSAPALVAHKPIRHGYEYINNNNKISYPADCMIFDVQYTATYLYLFLVLDVHTQII